MTKQTDSTKFALSDANARDLKLAFTQYENEVGAVDDATEIAKSKLEALAKKIVTVIGDAGIKTGEATDEALAAMREACVRTNGGKEIKKSANLWNKAVKAAFAWQGSTLIESKARKAEAAAKTKAAKEKAIKGQAEKLGTTEARIARSEKIAALLVTDDLVFLNVEGLLGAMARKAKSYGIKAKLAAEEVAELHPQKKAA